MLVERIHRLDDGLALCLGYDPKSGRNGWWATRDFDEGERDVVIRLVPVTFEVVLPDVDD